MALEAAHARATRVPNEGLRAQELTCDKILGIGCQDTSGRNKGKGLEMSVSAIGSAPVMPMSSERAEGAGPDHDGDSDDAAVQAPVQAAPAPGTGVIVNKTA